MLSLVASPTRTGESSLRVDLDKRQVMGLEMTEIKANFGLGMKYKGLILVFWGFCVGNRERQIGLGDETQFLQSCDWGKEGNSFDALK